LVGPIANLFESGVEKSPVQSYVPKYGPATYDISDQIRQANLSNAIASYNAANRGVNTGASMAYQIQNAIARNNAIANLYQTKRNKEVDMAFQNAGIHNTWGQFDATARHTAQVENEQNRATLRNIRRKGLGDLSTRLQQINADRNKSEVDSAMLDAMKPYLKISMTAADVDALYKKFKR
jgi:hypothetical protein